MLNAQIVGTRGEHEVHQLMLIETRRENIPDSIADERVRMQLVDRPKHGRLERCPLRASESPRRMITDKASRTSASQFDGGRGGIRGSTCTVRRSRPGLDR